MSGFSIAHCFLWAQFYKTKDSKLIEAGRTKTAAK
jgi:hypothetical protein